MEEILHQLIWRIYHYLYTGFYTGFYLRWCRISSIKSTYYQSLVPSPKLLKTAEDSQASLERSGSGNSFRAWGYGTKLQQEVTVDTVDGSEIPWPTTVLDIYENPVNNGISTTNFKWVNSPDFWTINGIEGLTFFRKSDELGENSVCPRKNRTTCVACACVVVNAIQQTPFWPSAGSSILSRVFRCFCLGLEHAIVFNPSGW